MKTRFLKRKPLTLALMLALAMVFALAACNGNNTNGGHKLSPSATKEGDDVPNLNGVDFGLNLEYVEEYVIGSDPGDYFSAAEAAKLTFETMRDNGNIPNYSDGMEYTMTLVDLTDIEGEECYVFKLDWGSDTAGAAYAYAYQSGNIYMQGQMGIWVMPE